MEFGIQPYQNLIDSVHYLAILERGILFSESRIECIWKF